MKYSAAARNTTAKLIITASTLLFLHSPAYSYDKWEALHTCYNTPAALNKRVNCPLAVPNRGHYKWYTPVCVTNTGGYHQCLKGSKKYCH